MKVLIVTTSYPDYEGSNRGIFIRKLCREIVNQGIGVAVLTPRIFKESPLFEEDSGIRVYRFRYPSGGTPLNQLPKIPVFSMCLYMISGFFCALSLILREKPDIIHGNWIVPTGLIASLAGFLTKTPVVNTARGMDIRVSEKGIIRFLFDLAVKLSDKVTVVSRAMTSRDVLKDAEVITSGVDLDFFGVSPDHTSKAILHIRSLEPVYDVQTLIRAVPLVIRKIPDARLIIAGSGSQEGLLKKISGELGMDGCIRFLGSVSSQKIASLMGHASVYVSTAIADGTSIALLEAIAAGLVPVVTDIDPNRAYITHGVDGYLFKPRDPQDLAEKILRALSHEIPGDVLEKKRYAMQESVCWGNIAKKIITHYNLLLGNTEARRP